MIGSGMNESDGMESKVEKEQPVYATLPAKTGYANDCIPLENKSNVTVVTGRRQWEPHAEQSALNVNRFPERC